MQYPERTYTYNIVPLGHLNQVEREAVADQILSRYLAGEEVRDICKDFSISTYTAYGLLVSCREEVWKDISVARALSRYAAAERDLDAVRSRLETATDSLELGKVREIVRLTEAQMKGAAWQLEKLYRRLFGNDVPSPGTGTVSISINFASEPKTVDGEANQPIGHLSDRLLPGQ